MKKIFLLQFFATIVLFVWGYGFFHLINMGTMPVVEDCPHAQTSHELCKLILTTQTTEKTFQNDLFTFLLLSIPIIFVILPVIQYIQKVSKETENESIDVIQYLFSKGILNSKIP